MHMHLRGHVHRTVSPSLVITGASCVLAHVASDAKQSITAITMLSRTLFDRSIATLSCQYQSSLAWTLEDLLV